MIDETKKAKMKALFDKYKMNKDEYDLLDKEWFYDEGVTEKDFIRWEKEVGLPLSDKYNAIRFIAWATPF